MNYIKELNAFYNQIIFNPLSSSAVALWHTLIHFNNLCGWKQEFSVAATQLQLKAGLKSTTFKRAREELLEGGWIHVKSPGANRAAIYQMISQQMVFEQNNPSTPIHPNQSSDNTPAQQHTDDKTVDGTDHNLDHTTRNSTDHNAGHMPDHSMDLTTAPFFKQKNTKQNVNKNQTTTADAIRFYQDNFERVTPFISEEILNWINDMGELLILHAMKLSLEQGKTTWRYVKGILNAWAKKGIHSLEAAKAEETAYRNRKTKRPQQSNGQQHADIVPDWFRERKRLDHAPIRDIHNKPSFHTKDTAAEEKELKALLDKYASKDSTVQGGIIA